jgi:hypothetical protein
MKQRAIIEEKLFEQLKYENILHELQHVDIICEKYNQSFEQKYQNNDHYQCVIKISKSGNDLIVWNYKPNGYKKITQVAE